MDPRQIAITSMLAVDGLCVIRILATLQGHYADIAWALSHWRLFL